MVRSFTFSKYRLPVLLLLLLTTALLSQEPPKRIPEGMFLPNFRDVEIADFLKTMAMVTRRNILVDDSIKGKITVVAYKPLPVAEALSFMKRVLEVRGFAVVEEGGLIKITKTADAVTQSENKAQVESKDSDIITTIYRVPEYANINEILTFFQKSGGKDVTIEPFRSSNTIVISGYAPRVRRLIELASEILPEKKAPKERSTEGVHIYQVMNLQAESLATVLVKLDSPVTDDAGKEGKPVQPVKIRAVAHKESNSIVITAGREEWVEIRRIIEQLDRERRQILLEVLIAEVSGKETNDFGIDWRYMGSNFGHTQFNTGMAVQGGLVDTKTGTITGNNTLSGFSVGFLKRGGDLMAIFNANVSNQNFNVLSAPQILTLDNQEAEINVGQDVPVKTQERKSGGGTSEATVNSFEYRPSGIKLKFTPNINSRGNIVLELFSEVTNIEGGGTDTTINPTFNKRNVKTFVNVDNGQTVVIGGLVSNEKLTAVHKVPLLGDIPLIGFAFRRTTITTRRTNLMVFLTPMILDDRTTADRLTKTKRAQQIDVGRLLQEEIRLWPQRRVKSVREQKSEEGRDQDIYIVDPENRPAQKPE